MKVFQKKISAFSLLEIALALAIVGVLSVGAMKGYSLLKRARLQRVVETLQGIDTAYTLFLEQYGAIPGDSVDAKNIWGEKARPGNGNGVIEGNPLTPFSDASLFWQHLDLSGLFKAKDWYGSDPYVTGIFIPKLSQHLVVTATSRGSDDRAGVYLKISGPPNGRHHLTPEEARFLDKQLDDGQPLQGRVKAREADGYSPGDCLNAHHYAIHQKKPACVVYVELD